MKDKIENVRVKLLVLFVMLLMLVFVNQANHTHYEDGSGTITIGYCVPFTLCDK